MKFKVLQNYATKLLSFSKFSRSISIKSIRFSEENISYYRDTTTPLHKVGKNFVAKDYVITKDTKQLLTEHLERTGGQIRTRFPPEPNGLLHIGHAKSININFSYAEAENGVCFLRYDDTNPEMENEKYVHGIQEMIKWLGFQAHEITYASDYFQQLCDMAVKLIDKDLAYVCHQARGTFNTEISPWRGRPNSDSLIEFRNMKNRIYNEGEATLRLKMTTNQGTVDPVAYRIKFFPHHRTKDQWCIYPTYDYAHSLCDSIQDITHSFCSSEFYERRSTYYWICNAVGVYCPVQIEFGRLNLLYNLISKRKIAALVEAGIVKGWDDPRLFTLAALRRRGFPPEAINRFCSNFGLRTCNAYIEPIHLNHYVREELEQSAPRIMAVFDPLKLVITNYPFNEPKEFEVPDIPHDHSKGHHTVSFNKEIFIERSDFQEVHVKGFRRLTDIQGVGLKHTSLVISLEEIVLKPFGEIDYLKVKCVPLKEAPKKPKAYIHWVAEPIEAEANVYENLFKSEKPDNLDKVPNGFLSDVNPDSLTTSKILIGKCSLDRFLPYQRFQFERVGYFAVDSDSKDEHLIFNKIIGLKQEKGF